MRWKITGADASSGKELVVELDAANEEDARANAQYRNILVSEVLRVDAPSMAPTISYASPATNAALDPVRNPTIGKRSKRSRFARREWRSKLGLFGLNLISALFYIAGFGMLFGSRFDAAFHSKRFDSANAFGAVANAAEGAESWQLFMQGLGTILIGCMFHAIRHLAELRWDLKEIYEKSQRP